MATGYPGFAYAGCAYQTTSGTAVAPTKFARVSAISKGQETIKTEKGYDGLNREYSWIAKVSQMHELSFTSQMYPDFFTASLFHMYGIQDLVSGTLTTGSSTLSASAVAGATTFGMTSSAGYSVGQVMLLGTAGSAGSELVTIGTIAATTFTPTAAVRYAHASGAAAVGVTDPYTHTGTSSNAIPASMSFEHSIGHLPATTAQGGVGAPLDVVRVPDGIWTGIKLAAAAGKVGVTNYDLVGRLGVPGQSAAAVVFETDAPMVLSGSGTTFTVGAYASTPGTGMDILTANVTEFGFDGKLTPDPVQVAGSLAPYQNSTVRGTMLNCGVWIPAIGLMREVWYGSSAGTTPVQQAQNATFQVKFDEGLTPDHFVTLLFNNFVAEAGIPTFSSDGKAMIFRISGPAMPSGATGAMTVTAQNGYAGNYFWSGA